MNRIRLNNKNVREAAAEWTRNFGDDYRAMQAKRGLASDQIERMMRSRATEEALANLSGKHGRNIRLKGLRQFIAEALKLMRAMGFEALPNFIESLTDAEALSMIVAAREVVTVGDATVFTGAPAGEAQFQQTTDAEFSRAQDMESLLEESGEAVETREDARRRLAAGERIFAFHEMGDAPTEIINAQEIDNWSPDTLMALPVGAQEAAATSPDIRFSRGHEEGSAPQGRTMGVAEGTDAARPATQEAEPGEIVDQRGADINQRPDGVGPTIDHWAKDLALLRGFIESVTDKLRRNNMRPLATAIDNFYDSWSAYRGDVMGDDRIYGVQQKLRGLSRAKRKEALDTFRRYQAANQNGREETAKAIRDRGGIVAEMIDAVEWMYDHTGKLNQEKGVRVFDPKTGKWRLIGKIDKRKMWSRMFSPEVNDLLFLHGPNSNPALWNKLADALMREGHISTPDEAWQYVNDVHGERTRNDFFAGIERARTLAMPEEFYDYSWDAAMNYVDAWAHRISQIEQFGQKKGMNDKDMFDEAIDKAGDDRTHRYIESARNSVYNMHLRDGEHSFLASSNMVATGLQLANPFTATRNLGTGIIANWFEHGTKASVLAMRDLAVNGRQAYQHMTRNGVLKEDLLSIMHDLLTQGGNRKLSIAVNKAMKLGWYTITGAVQPGRSRAGWQVLPARRPGRVEQEPKQQEVQAVRCATFGRGLTGPAQ